MSKEALTKSAQVAVVYGPGVLLVGQAILTGMFMVGIVSFEVSIIPFILYIVLVVTYSAYAYIQSDPIAYTSYIRLKEYVDKKRSSH